MIRTLILSVAGAALWAASAQAQDAVLEQLYGKGVHAYFAGDYGKALERLSAAAGAGSRDPRVYYFCGLTYLKLGKAAEAQMDFRKGAQLETRDLNRYYNVGRALERVQGADRQMLESYRVQARMAAYAESEKLRKARYEAIKREEARVLQEQAAESAEAASPPTEIVPASGGEATAAEPGAAMAGAAEGAAVEGKKAAGGEMESGGAMENPPAPKTGTREKAGTEEDPFAPKPAEEKKGAETAPAEEKKAADAAPVAKKGLFGALGRSLNKAVTGGDKAGADAKPVEAADPFAK
jgi:tetratricopeptide (TPR) repeat protein